jgi:amino acid transporter
MAGNRAGANLHRRRGGRLRAIRRVPFAQYASRVDHSDGGRGLPTQYSAPVPEYSFHLVCIHCHRCDCPRIHGHNHSHRRYALPRCYGFQLSIQRISSGQGFLFWAGTLIATYDYGGYYNVCLIGSEVAEPRKTIPRSIIFSILIVAAIYLVMNISILGVLPWREAMHSHAIVADFMVRVYGQIGGNSIALLILIAAFGSVFAILLGYSRIPYAAAVEGHFFSIFGKLHPKGQFPYVSLVAMGVSSAFACMFTLESLITALIVTQTLLQFAAQCVAVVLLRRQKRDTTDAYRMPFYPLPALIALAGWIYIVVTSGARYIVLAGAFLVIGISVFLLRARQKRDWPFGEVIV